MINLEKELVFTFLMLSAKQGHYWYYFYNVYRGPWVENRPWPPTLDASTLPREGGINDKDLYYIAIKN